MDFIKPNVLYHSDVDEKGKCMANSINRTFVTRRVLLPVK